MKSDIAFGSQFDAPSEERWLTLVEKALRGGTIDSLRSKTYDGIEIQPLYRAVTTRYPDEMPGDIAVPNGGPSWGIVTVIDHPDPQVANKHILEDLDGGATGIELKLDIDGAGEVPGTIVRSIDDLDAVFADVFVDIITVRLVAGAHVARAGELFDELCTKRGVVNPNARYGSDPIGFQMQTGRTAELFSRASGENVVSCTVDGSPIAAAGGSNAQELGAMLATAALYLRELDSDIDVAATQLEFVVSVDANVFESIAKLRAFRRLWSHLLAESGSTDPTAYRHVTARSNRAIMSNRDVYVNMLRTTAACFAGAIGGADSIVLDPFDVRLGSRSSLGSRMVRNTQLILAEESRLGDVVDPMGGSYFVESLTSELVDASWAYFVSIEQRGGIEAVLSSEQLHADIEVVALERSGNVATRSDPLTGVSEFPNLYDDEPKRDQPTYVESSEPPPFVPLPLRPRGAAFEALRDASDAFTKKNGHRPRIFLANLGPIAAHNARSSFAKNFFEAGGIEPLGPDGFETAETLAAAFSESGAHAAVLCSSDAVYETLAADAASALTAAGATWLAIAGAGVNVTENKIHVGCNAIEILRDIATQLGVQLAGVETPGVES